MSEHNLSAQEFSVLLNLLMVSDPWPLEEIDRVRLIQMMDEESQSRNYANWVEAYHEMEN